MKKNNINPILKVSLLGLYFERFIYVAVVDSSIQRKSERKREKKIKFVSLRLSMAKFYLSIFVVCELSSIVNATTGAVDAVFSVVFFILFVVIQMMFLFSPGKYHMYTMCCLFNSILFVGRTKMLNTKSRNGYFLCCCSTYNNLCLIFGLLVYLLIV